MVIKLKSALQNPRLRLMLKAAIFAVLLAWASVGGLKAAPVLLFIFAAATLFLRPIFQTVQYFLPLLVFLPATLIFLRQLHGFYFWSGLIFCAILFYVLIGIKNLILVNREQAQVFFVMGTLLMVLFSFFSGNFGEMFYAKIIAVFIAAGFLLNMIFNQAVVAWLAAFLIAQIILALALLPIGFIQSTALTAAIIFIVQNLIRHRRGMVAAALLLASLVLIVFLTSKWGL